MVQRPGEENKSKQDSAFDEFEEDDIVSTSQDPELASLTNTTK